MISAEYTFIMQQDYYYQKIEADYLSKISIFELKKDGLLKTCYSTRNITWNRNGKICERVDLEVNPVKNLKGYFHGKEVARDGFVRFKHQNYDYNINLCTTDCNYGRFRYWFICPICSKRVGVVYLRGGLFACRHCQCLTYESRKLSGHWKQLGRIISNKEMKVLRKDFKRKFYNGIPTRKFRRYIKAKIRMGEIYRSMGFY